MQQRDTISCDTRRRKVTMNVDMIDVEVEQDCCGTLHQLKKAYFGKHLCSARKVLKRRRLSSLFKSCW